MYYLLCSVEQRPCWPVGLGHLLLYTLVVLIHTINNAVPAPFRVVCHLHNSILNTRYTGIVRYRTVWAPQYSAVPNYTGTQEITVAHYPGLVRGPVIVRSLSCPYQCGTTTVL